MQTENNLTPEELAELEGLNKTGLTAAEQAELDELNGVKKKEDTAPVSGTSAPKLPAVVEQLMQRSNQSGQKTEIVAPAPKLIEQKPTNEELFEQGVRPNPAKLQAEINRIEPILIKQTNELRSTQNKAAAEYSTYEDNQKYPAFIELQKLYAQANQQTAAGQDNTETVRQIQELRNKPVDDSWRQQGKIQVSESQTIPVPYLKKTPYKNYGELYDATFKAGENYNTLKKKAEQLNSEIAPQKDFIRKQSNYVPTATDEQGNEYYELNPMESFINGFGNSMDVLNFALMKANPLVTDQELQDEMKLKYVRDNIIFPKQSDSILAKGTEMLGGVTPLIAGGVVAGGGLGGLAVNSLLFGAQDYGGTLYGTYAEEKAKNPDISDEEAFKLAEKNAQFAGIKGAALGATMPIQSAAGRKLFLNGAEAGAFKKFLAEQGVMAPAFGASTAAQNWFEGKPLGEGADKAMLDAFIIGGMTHAIGGVPNLSKNFRTTFENVVAKNYDKLGAMLSEAQSKGLISPETVATIREKSRAYSVVGKEIAPTIEAEVVDKGVELNNILDEIKARKEANSLADVSDLETRAEQINREIAEKKGSPLSAKEQKDYEKLIEKRDKVSKEGEKTELLQSEKEDIRHYEARIEQAKKNAEDVETTKPTTDGEVTQTGVRPDETASTNETTAIEPTGETVTQETTVLREGEKPVAEESETIKQQQNDNIPTTEPVQKEIAGTEPNRIAEETGKETEISAEKTGEEIFARAAEKKIRMAERDKILEEFGENSERAKNVFKNFKNIISDLSEKGIIKLEGDCF